MARDPDDVPRLIGSAAPVLLADADSGLVLQWSDAAGSLFELPAGAASEIHLGDLLPELPAQAPERCDHTQGQTATGRPLALDVNVTRLEVPGEPAVVILMVSEERTLRRKAEMRLRESEERFRALYDDNPTMFFTVGQDGLVRSANTFGAAHLGYTPEELEGQPVTMIFADDDKAQIAGQLKEAVAKVGEPLRWELRKVCKDGRVIWVREVARAVHGPSGEIVVLIVCEDITDLKALETRLSVQNERLMHLDRLKNEFVGTVSHELRTPLTSIRGYAELLEDEVGGPLTGLQRGYVDAIQESTCRLQRLVDDLLDFSGLEAGEFKLRLEPADPVARVRATAEALRPRIQAADMELALELPPAAPEVVMDPVRIAQVLTNLIDNAVKFGRPSCEVRVRLKSQAGAVRIEVVDSGRGIDRRDQDRIFDRFVQLDGGDTRTASGAGLGLAIARGIVEAHGGRIGVDSQRGQGSTFWFELPVGGPPTRS